MTNSKQTGKEVAPLSADPVDHDDPDAIAKLRHDFRTPINHIIGYSELLLEEAESSPLQTYTGDLGKIHSAGKTLLGMIDTLISPKAIETLDDQSNSKGNHNKPLSLTENSHAKQRPLPEFQNGELLVVDDNAVNRDMLVRRLEHQGYRVTEAEDGLQALKVIERRDVDLVLLDVLMPGMDGFETLCRLKGDSRFRDIPVIMISALDELQSVVRCIEHGAEDYLPKPFNPVLLRARIGACLEKKHLRDQEVKYLQDVSLVTDAATAVETGQFNGEILTQVIQRQDELGQLASVFKKMADEVLARELRFKEQIETLRIEIDETKKNRQVAELTESDFFQKLQNRARTRLRHYKENE